MADEGIYITPTSNPTAGRWVRALHGQTANVKMWGAVGNGTNDDWASIKNAIDACTAGFTMELLFPSGIYRVTNTLVFPGQLHLRGEGLWDNTAIVMPPGIQKDIFRTENADRALTGLSPGWTMISFSRTLR